MASLVCTPWVTPGDLPEDVQAAADTAGPDVAADACAWASELLFALSGRRWPGACGERTVELTLGPAVRPTLADRRRAVLGGGTASGARAVHRVRLPDWPVTAVTAVTERRDPEPADPVPLVEEQWRLVNGRWLARYQDGVPVAWPVCRIVVTYEHGAPPPDGGVRAAREYAVQLVWAAAGDKERCKLPSRVQNITRQGVSMVLLDPGDYLDEGRTGVPGVDQWLAAVNPGRLRSRPRVWSPDTDRTTTTYT